jgi:hypothetical protein
MILKGLGLIISSLSLLSLMSCSGNEANVVGATTSTTAVASKSIYIAVNGKNTVPIQCVVNQPLILKNTNSYYTNSTVTYTLSITTLGTTIPTDWTNYSGSTISGSLSQAASVEVNQGTFNLAAFAASKGLTFETGKYYRINLNTPFDPTELIMGGRALLDFSIQPMPPLVVVNGNVTNPSNCIYNTPVILSNGNSANRPNVPYSYLITITNFGSTYQSNWETDMGPKVSGEVTSASINGGTFDLGSFAISESYPFVMGSYYRISLEYRVNGVTVGTGVGNRLIFCTANPSEPSVVVTQNNATGVNFTSADYVAERGKTNVPVFRGSNYLLIPNSTSINFGTGDFSVSLWVKTSSSSTQTLLDKRDANDVGYHMVVYSGVVLFQVQGPNGFLNHYSLSSKKVNDNQWHHIVVTIDRDNTSGGKIYVDNVLQYQFNPVLSFGSVTNTAPLYIGRHKNGNGFIGLIDDFKLSNKSLTASEVSYLFLN